MKKLMEFPFLQQKTAAALLIVIILLLIICRCSPEKLSTILQLSNE